jgi:hypothetical protein
MWRSSQVASADTAKAYEVIAALAKLSGDMEATGQRDEALFDAVLELGNDNDAANAALCTVMDVTDGAIDLAAATTTLWDECGLSLDFAIQDGRVIIEVYTKDQPKLRFEVLEHD